MNSPSTQLAVQEEMGGNDRRLSLHLREPDILVDDGARGRHHRDQVRPHELVGHRNAHVHLRPGLW